METDTPKKKVTGADLLGKALARQQVNTLFYLMGAPTYDAETFPEAVAMVIHDA